jgi:hypothetical protein
MYLCSMTRINGKELHFVSIIHRHVSNDAQAKHPLGYFPHHHSHIVLYTGQTGASCKVNTESLIKIRINVMFDKTRNPT